MNALTYKGYTGVFEYDPEADLFHGEVAGIKDVVTFQGRSLDELRQALVESLEFYLVACAEDGVQPEKPASGILSVRLGPQLHGKAAVAAKASGKSLNAFVAQAVGKAVSDVGL